MREREPRTIPGAKGRPMIVQATKNAVIYPQTPIHNIGFSKLRRRVVSSFDFSSSLRISSRVSSSVIVESDRCTPPAKNNGRELTNPRPDIRFLLDILGR